MLHKSLLEFLEHRLLRNHVRIPKYHKLTSRLLKTSIARHGRSTILLIDVRDATSVGRENVSRHVC
jgi:hypothetical protein